MWRERLVPSFGLTFVVIAALTLGTVIVRSPDTHGHTWSLVPANYDRTPLAEIHEADLPAVLADLPPFTFPAPSTTGVRQQAVRAPAIAETMPGMGTTMPHAGMTTEVQQVTLTQTEYGITPDRLTLKVGVPVELTVKNEGSKVHGLWLPDFGIAEDVRSGRTQTFKFTPEKPGRFRYTCSYSLCGTEDQHARMVGFLTVEQ